MIKKAFLICIILLIISGGVFAQNQEKAKNAFALSFGILGAELSYERMFNRYFSVLADVSYTTLIFIDEFTASGKGRWYPFGRAFYLELGFGYTYGRGIIQFYSDTAVAAFALVFLPLIPFLDIDYEFFRRTGGFLVQGCLGWRIDVGKPNRFLLPISMGINIKIGSYPDFKPYFRMGVGYAF